jgi:predicted GIY-YIG superfamily endonuclease
MNAKILTVGKYSHTKPFLPKRVKDNLKYLYAISLSNGLLKVGMTQNPNDRLANHAIHARTYGKAEIVEIIIAGPYQSPGKREDELIKNISKSYSQLDDTDLEWFHFNSVIDSILPCFPA